MNQPTQPQNIETQQEKTTDETTDKLVAAMDPENPQNKKRAINSLGAVFEIFAENVNYQSRKNNAREFFAKDVDIHRLFSDKNYRDGAEDAILLGERHDGLFGRVLGIKVNDDLGKTKQALHEVKSTQKEIDVFRNERNTILIRSLQWLNNLDDDEMAEVIKNAKNSLGAGRSIEDSLRLETLRKTRFKIDKLIEEIKIEAVNNNEVLTESELNNRLQAKLNGETYETLGKKSIELTEKHQGETKETEKQIVQKGKEKVAAALGVELKPEVTLQAQTTTPIQTTQAPTSVPVLPSVSPLPASFVPVTKKHASASVSHILSVFGQNIQNSFSLKIWQPLSNFGSNFQSFKPGLGTSGFLPGLKDGLLNLANLFKIGANKGLSSGLASKALAGALGLGSGGIGLVLAGLASTILSSGKFLLVILVFPIIIFYMLFIGQNPFSSNISELSYQTSIQGNKYYVWQRFEENYFSMKKTDTLSETGNKIITTSSWDQFEYLTLNTDRHDDVKK